ncbi:MAG: ATP-dependent DNA helicase, partial [Bacteroidota bacterium]
MHSFCFELLRSIDPSYEIFDVFSEEQEYALLLRIGPSIGLNGGKTSLKHHNDLGITPSDEIEWFLKSLDVIHNELIDESTLLDTAPLFYQVYEAYRSVLQVQRVLSFGLIIREAVEHVSAMPASINPLDKVKYLFVDEYQDTNTAQERLIQSFYDNGSEICTVGDDDQCIYNWRGSNVENFLAFQSKYGARLYNLPENMRSQPTIVCAAESIAKKLNRRIDKRVLPGADLTKQGISREEFPNPGEEAIRICEQIKRLYELGYQYREIGVLFRSVKTSGTPLMEELDRAGIPYRILGATALFGRPGIRVMSDMFFAWAERTGVGAERRDGVPYVELFRQSLSTFIRDQLPALQGDTSQIYDELLSIGRDRCSMKRPDLVEGFTQALAVMQMHRASGGEALLADMATFSNLIADVQAVFLRNIARGGTGNGEDLVNDIVWFILRYASSNYEATSNVDPSDIDSVSIATVHQAKGLEWAAVFIPSLVGGRFPPSGRGEHRFLPEELYPKRRYDVAFSEDQDPERRLFYVAVTRAKELLFLSSFKKVKKVYKPSILLADIPADCIGPLSRSHPHVPCALPGCEIADLTCTELVEYHQCPYYYRLRRVWGFKTSLPEELGYGTNLHHLAHLVLVQEAKPNPSGKAIEEIVESGFHMPYAPRPVADKIRVECIEKLEMFRARFADMAKRIRFSEVELSFSLCLARVSCRPDLVVSTDSGGVWVVDLKNQKGFTPNSQQRLQVLAYAIALRAAGSTPERVSLYNFEDGRLHDFSLGVDELEEAQRNLSRSVEGIRKKSYTGNAGDHCRACDYRQVCVYFRRA